MNSFRFAHFRIRILAEEVLKKSEFEAPLLARARFHFAQFQQEDAKSNSCAHPKHEKKEFMRFGLPPLTPSPTLLYIGLVLTGLLYESCLQLTCVSTRFCLILGSFACRRGPFKGKFLDFHFSGFAGFCTQ